MLEFAPYREKKNNHHHLNRDVRMSSANDFEFFSLSLPSQCTSIDPYICVCVLCILFFQFAGELRLKRFSLVNFEI